MDDDVVGLAGQLHRHLADELVRLNEAHALEVVKAVVEQADGLGKAAGLDGAVLQRGALRAQHDGDELPSGADGGGDEAVARLGRRAGLDAPCVLVVVPRPAGAPRGDQVVGRVQLPLFGDVRLRHGVGLAPDDLHERVVLHRLLRDEVDVPRAGVVPVVVQAGGVGEVRVRTAELLRALVHQRHEGVDVAGDRLGEDVGRFVGRNDEQAVEQVLHSHGFARLDVGGAAVGGEVLKRALLRRDLLIHAQPSRVYRLQRQQRGHDLRDAGGVVALVRLFLIERFA